MVSIVTQLATDYAERACVGMVDTTTQSALVARYAIQWVPTMVFFKGGREVSRKVGSASYDELAKQLDAVIAGP